MAVEVIGWDIGGAHLKAAAIDGGGRLVQIVQEPCALWLGLDRLAAALESVRAQLQPDCGCRQAVTMTGELADCFASREEGVAALVQSMAAAWPGDGVSVFAGRAGFIPAEAVGPEHAAAIASANWLACGTWTAAALPEALFVDVGSTTTDILPVSEHRVVGRGYTDYERMRYDELVYTGVVRTPVMALADRAPLAGEWVGLMAEHFATTADIYRLTGELPEAADQHPSADLGPKTPAGSRRRLARVFGRDAEGLTDGHWCRAARFLRERQLSRIRDGLELQLSRHFPEAAPPLVGAGVGRFLLRDLALRLGMDYVDFSALFDHSSQGAGFEIDDCAPAAAVASLALKEKETP